MTRQAVSIARLRAARAEAGLCFDCGKESKTFRCARCNAARRAPMRALMSRRRAR